MPPFQSDHEVSMVPTTIYCEQTRGMLMALLASGAPAPESLDKCQQFLEIAKSTLPPGDINCWKEFFNIIGEFAIDINRFDIIYSIIASLKSIDEIDTFGETWMNAIHTANIHPISIPLCTTSHSSLIRNHWTHKYHKLYNATKHPRITSYHDKDNYDDTNKSQDDICKETD